MARILTLDASMAACSVGLVENGAVLEQCRIEGDLAAMPAAVERILSRCGRSVDRVAVVVGPGSFTGLRASVALAHGIALAAGAPVMGVTVGAALCNGDLPVWAAVDNKRGRVFLERDGRIEALTLDCLPIPAIPIVLGGDAAMAVGEILSSRGGTVRLTTATPDPLGIARAATGGRTVPALPAYAEPPAARPGPAGRPAPA